MSELQVLCGFAVVIKATLFILPCMMSQFTKKMGKSVSGLYLGLLTSANGVGPMVGALIGGTLFVPLYATWFFLLFSIPCAISAFSMLIPPVYKFMAAKPTTTPVALPTSSVESEKDENQLGEQRKGGG